MLQRILIVTALSMTFFSLNSVAQSAVYFCKINGTYGFCYGEKSEMAARECAYNNCIKSGGSQPTVVAFTQSKGFGAICVGEDALGNAVIGVALGYDTQAEADAEARRQCEDLGGYKNADTRAMGRPVDVQMIQCADVQMK